MTSVVQVFTRTGKTEVPELRFGADGGTFATAHGYTALSGAQPFRLQRFRGSVQHQWPGSERRLFQLAPGSQPRYRAHSSRAAPLPHSPFQQPYWRTKRVEFQWTASHASGSGPEGAAEQFSGQCRTNRCRSLALAASPQRLRVQP